MSEYAVYSSNLLVPIRQLVETGESSSLMLGISGVSVVSFFTPVLLVHAFWFEVNPQTNDIFALSSPRSNIAILMVKTCMAVTLDLHAPSGIWLLWLGTGTLFFVSLLTPCAHHLQRMQITVFSFASHWFSKFPSVFFPRGFCGTCPLCGCVHDRANLTFFVLLVSSVLLAVATVALIVHHHQTEAGTAIWITSFLCSLLWAYLVTKYILQWRLDYLDITPFAM